MELALRSIGLHLVAYEAVASPPHVQFACAVYITFSNIVTNDNEPLVAPQANIHVAAHINGVGSMFN